MTIRMIALATLVAAPTALMAQDTPPQGSMPLSQYTLIHRDARLSDEERRELIDALQEMDESR